jgi:hypothetical protein
MASMNALSISRIQDLVLRAVVEEFQPRFVPDGNIVWLSEARETSCCALIDKMVELRFEIATNQEFPNVVINDSRRGWIFLIDVVTLKGPMNRSRCRILRGLFEPCENHLVLINAFKSRSDICHVTELPWSISAWFADEPDHIIHFDGVPPSCRD